jgi:hypothetical protein
MYESQEFWDDQAAFGPTSAELKGPDFAAEVLNSSDPESLIPVRA